MAIEYLGLSQINGSLIAIEGMKEIGRAHV